MLLARYRSFNNALPFCPFICSDSIIQYTTYTGDHHYRLLTAVDYCIAECNCFGHADTCVYNETVAERHLSINIHGVYEGGGVCIDCQVSCC